jgi:hypothetical protein
LLAQIVSDMAGKKQKPGLDHTATYSLGEDGAARRGGVAGRDDMAYVTYARTVRSGYNISFWSTWLHPTVVSDFPNPPIIPFDGS